ncbi:uncharacterized protein TOL2_C40360 [Desulfobacula toluolica Tol2]|uniref:Uncharacterized protein n=2 Tax=Desulfobacula toluolica TaxID=28223 RepID=K0NKU2_DESTT|nr:uncharacterized protein TOL2_C40360 [Desulfobacula toluolica Tol2]
MFPKNWRSKKINAKAMKISEDEIVRSLEIIKLAIQKYPAYLVRENLTKVYIVHKLSYFGVSTSGTNSHNRIYIANSGLSKGYTNDFVEKLFHAEFSSILLRNHKSFFTDSSWKRINPVNFRYGKSGVDFVKKGKASERFKNEFLNAGFLNQYATSTLENDFNSVVKRLFMNEKKLWEIARYNKAIGQKILLTLEFYHKLNPIFTRKYFQLLPQMSFKRHFYGDSLDFKKKSAITISNY